MKKEWPPDSGLDERSNLNFERAKLYQNQGMDPDEALELSALRDLELRTSLSEFEKKKLNNLLNKL